MTRRIPTAAELLAELESHIALLVFAVVKEIARGDGRPTGSMPCPRCKTGTLRWSIAQSNGRARVVCDRWIGVRDGEPIRCIDAME